MKKIAALFASATLLAGCGGQDFSATIAAECRELSETVSLPPKNDDDAGAHILASFNPVKTVVCTAFAPLSR